MWVIVGLGNPGRKYERTRHNVGFGVADSIATGAGGRFRRDTHGDLTARVEWEGERILLVKPQTFMNLSGPAVARAAPPESERLVVVCDDLNLPLGNVRLREGGSDGGHKGLRSIIETLGSDRFIRLRVGLGRPPEGEEAAEFVLRSFDRGESEAIGQAVARAVECLRVLLARGLAAAMNDFNRRATPAEP
ncbi:MAG: aminoacyl-tRNA hydrolase [Nitrospirae bacterium]|nr:aminoacyl-tRNA hydrolase [Nitrospirota bacterium]